jgi:uncharacterized protein (TIGR03084 family)
MTIFDDLEAELDRLDEILSGLSDDQWAVPSLAAGWSVADVVLHLAQSEESVVAVTTGAGIGERPPAGMSVDQAMDYLVSAQRAEPSEVFGRWQAARLAAVAALRSADPARPLEWIEAPLKPATMATTRLAETWAHALDITEPLGIDLPDTDRLAHIAWLAHRSLAYAFTLAGEGSQPIHCRLITPDGLAVWEYGSAGAESGITGMAGEFCRVAAQRLAPEQSGLQASGPHGDLALRIVRTYAA